MFNSAAFSSTPRSLNVAASNSLIVAFGKVTPEFSIFTVFVATILRSPVVAVRPSSLLTSAVVNVRPLILLRSATLMFAPANVFRLATLSSTLTGFFSKPPEVPDAGP